MRLGPRPPSRGAEGGRHQRILFPFLGDSISATVLELGLRLARAEDATLVPAYLASVPQQLPLDAPIPQECETALPLLELIEQRAARQGVHVDSRIERGRSPRHALSETLDHETYDAVILPARTSTSDGFSADDIAWALENAPGDVFIIRPDQQSDDATRL